MLLHREMENAIYCFCIFPLPWFILHLYVALALDVHSIWNFIESQQFYRSQRTSPGELCLKEWPCDRSYLSYDKKLTLGHCDLGIGLDSGLFALPTICVFALSQIIKIFNIWRHVKMCMYALYLYSTGWKAEVSGWSVSSVCTFSLRTCHILLFTVWMSSPGLNYLVFYLLVTLC